MKPGIFLFLLIPLAAWGILRDVANTAHGGSIDLRNRVTGARIATAGIDPYSYKWNSGDPEEFCDLFNEPGSLLSKTTVTPWTLAAHTVFNEWNYRGTQWFWLFFQYGIFAGMFFLWAKREDGDTMRWGLVLTLLFCIGPPWRHHVDHGQIYVVYAAMFVLLRSLSQKKATSVVAVAEGLLGAFTLGSRPIFLGHLGAPIHERRWLALGGAGVGLLIVLVIPMLLFGGGIWNQYRMAMEVHAEVYLNEMRPQRVAVGYPGTIEGIPLNQLAGFSETIPFADTSLQKVLPFSFPPRTAMVLWLILMAGYLGFLIRKKANSRMFWWVIAAWVVIGDFLLPAFRHTYNDVLALPMVLFGLGALEGKQERKRWIVASAVVFGLMFLTWKIPGSLRGLIAIPSLGLWMMALGAVVTGWLKVCRPSSEDSGQVASGGKFV